MVDLVLVLMIALILFSEGFSMALMALAVAMVAEVFLPGVDDSFQERVCGLCFRFFV